MPPSGREGDHEVVEGDRVTDNFSLLPKAYGCSIRQVCTRLPAAANQTLRDAFSLRHFVPAPLKTVPVFGGSLIETTEFQFQLTGC